MDQYNSPFEVYSVARVILPPQKVFPVGHLVSEFLANGFIRLRRLRETPFEPPGLRADFCLGCWG
jgi:hypothetical protein